MIRINLVEKYEQRSSIKICKPIKVILFKKLISIYNWRYCSVFLDKFRDAQIERI